MKVKDRKRQELRLVTIDRRRFRPRLVAWVTLAALALVVFAVLVGLASARLVCG